MTFPPEGRDRPLVVERQGRIVALRGDPPAPVPFLDLSPIVVTDHSEQGLLSMAFHPGYAANGLAYVAYTPGPGRVTVARYRTSADNPDVADPHSGEVLLEVRKRFDGHNGGLVLFGPDGYLYVGIGDGVPPSEADRPGHAQDRSVLLGKLLRLDVDRGSPYGIPPDNPFVAEPGARPEIWAYGLRNPWRFSFDRATGDLYIGDVGLRSREEIDLQPAGLGGLNFGWNHLEGSFCRKDAATCGNPLLTMPIFDYERSMGGSVIGGYLYRGRNLPHLQGRYIFGDYKNGRIWALERRDPTGAWEPRLLAETGLRITSFGEDPDGELYLTNTSDQGLYRLDAAP